MNRLKSFKLFENTENVNQIKSIVKDMLLELSDLDYTTNCVIRRSDGREYIRIGISKPAVIKDIPDYEFSYQHISAAFEWSDIKEIMDPIMDYLESEGYEYRKDKGTLSYIYPIISTSGNAFDGIKSRCEMWFESVSYFD
jgi:hypothetical protein